MLRGKIKVEIEWGLLAIAQNISLKGAVIDVKVLFYSFRIFQK